jgi:hypothetical protein
LGLHYLPQSLFFTYCTTRAQCYLATLDHETLNGIVFYLYCVTQGGLQQVGLYHHHRLNSIIIVGLKKHCKCK